MTHTDLLAELRGSRSQADWAAALGVSQQVISWWESGGPIGAKGQAALIRLHPDHRDAIVEEVLKRQETSLTAREVHAD